MSAHLHASVHPHAHFTAPSPRRAPSSAPSPPLAGESSKSRLAIEGVRGRFRSHTQNARNTLLEGSKRKPLHAHPNTRFLPTPTRDPKHARNHGAEAPSERTP
jgi:hypothetical protein